MAVFSPQGHAFNRTRERSLATELGVADTHWTRLCGLLGTSSHEFRNGRGLWISPCRGVHTLAMRFPIDVIYLDIERKVVHLEQNLVPWRFAPVRFSAASVLELPCQTIAATETALGDMIEITVP